jgi:hypothetical protein
MNKPLFVETSEGYVINLALVRWIRIDKEKNKVWFHFADSPDSVDGRCFSGGRTKNPR